MKREMNTSIEQIKSPRYFKYSPWNNGSYIDSKRNIVILSYKFTNNTKPYTIKFNKNYGGFELTSEEDFERMTLFFEMMNEQGDQNSTG